MRKAFWLAPSFAAVAVVVGLTGIRCSSSPSSPSSTGSSHSALVSGTASTDGLDIGGGGSFPTWNVGGAQGDFRIHPTSGAPPLEVHVNMCHSTDPSPGISLHYHVTWGDGSDDRGFCRFDHIYPSDGRFSGRACVWDEIPAHAPGDCDTFTVEVTKALFCHSITAFGFAGTVIPGVCPTAATQFCSSGPIVATSSAQAQAACNACFGSCTNFTNSYWFGVSGNTAGGFLYASTCGFAPGTIARACGFPTASRWAP